MDTITETKVIPLRLAYLDNLKSLAIIFVVMTHAAVAGIFSLLVTQGVFLDFKNVSIS
jgi:surface polysaccharide O-acyltransferase-like enzyme